VRSILTKELPFDVLVL